MSPIPQSVIDKDHDLDGRTNKASEALAKHRWHQTLDPDGPRHSVNAYAKAVGRNMSTVSRYAKGYALFAERQASPARGKALSIQDAIRLADRSAEDQAFDEAIAEGSGKPVAQVSRGDNRHRTRATIERARQRAERRGTDPVDEARSIAAEEARAAHTRREREATERARHGARYLQIEGHLAGAQRRLTDALREAQGVGFTDEEMELIRHSLGAIKALLNLIDLRMAGTPDVDWDAEAARLMMGEPS